MASRYPRRTKNENVLPSSCGLCNRPDNDRMVQCDGCDTWYHFDCVNLTSITEEESWICPPCVQNQATIMNATLFGENQQNNSTIDNYDRRTETIRNEDEETHQSNLAIAMESTQQPHRVIFEELLLNRLPINQTHHRPTFDHQIFDRHTLAGNLTAPEASKGVFMAHRQIFGICSQPPPCIVHSTPGQQSNRLHNLTQHSAIRQQEVPGARINESQHTNYYSSNEYQPIRNESHRLQSPIHRQPQMRLDCEFDRVSIHSQTLPGSVRRFEQRSQAPPGSSTSTMSTSRRIQIELKKLEEERLAHQKYIDQKYQVLLQGCDKEKSTDRENYTQRWVNGLDQNRYDDFDEVSQISNIAPTDSKCNIDPKPKNSATEREDTVSQQKYEVKTPTDPPKIQTEIEVTNQVIQPSIPARKFCGIETGNELNAAESDVLNKRQIASRQVVTRDLPAYDGNPEDWPLFYSRYRNSTKLCGYSNAENMDRLQKCLKGKAETAVKPLLLFPESVPQVISTLRTLFGRPELIVNHLVNKVSKLPPPRMERLNTIVDFAMSVRNVSATIEAADLPEHLSNPTLITELEKKIPATLRLDWAKFKVLQPVVNLPTLSDWLYNLAEVVTTVTEPTFTTSDEQKASTKSAKKSSDNHNKRSEYLNVHQEGTKVEQRLKPKEEKESKSNDRQNQSKTCIICNKNCPNVAECTEFSSQSIGQRWKVVNTKKLCRTCLRLHFGFCRQNKSCGVNSCAMKHHPLLHDEQRVVKNSGNGSGQSLAEINSFHRPIKANANILLRIVPVKLFGDGCSINTFAFVDDGSTTSLIDERIAEKLNIRGTPKELCLLWSGTIYRTERNSHEINVGISSIRQNSTTYQLKGVKTVEQLGIPAQRLNKSEIWQKFPYLRNVPFDEYEAGLPGILIGSNNPKIGIPIEIIEGEYSEPIASNTRIGWTIHGPIGKSEISPQSFSYHTVEECSCDHEHDNFLHQYVKDYFSVENFGVQVNNSMNKDSKDNERALEQMQRMTRKVDSGYECGLLWRYDQFELPDSYGMALRRLQCLENRRSEVVSAINDTIVDYVAKGYATKISEAELLHNSNRVWYLPIFAVTHAKKPNKIRTVFDAAAKVNGVSLNSFLLKGPDQLVSLIEILRRFREKSVAAVGDIREMYHQIKTRTEDRNCQRFLWRNGEKRKPDVYIMNVMTFGATCSPSIAHHVKNFNASKFAEQFPEAVETITKNHYVDDMMESAHTEEEMIRLINEVKMIHTEGGFEIRNFLSNSKAVMAAVGNCDGSKEKFKSIVLEKEINIERVLGMWWNTDTDCFTFSLKYSPVNEDILLGKALPTKREMLKLLINLANIASMGPANIRIKNNRIVEKMVGTVTESRRNSNSTSLHIEIKSKELHIFVDAGGDAFGAVCYLRVEDEDGVDCSLVGSKARVAPIKYLSDPRKELQAAVIGTRLSSSIISSQNIVVNRKIFWSDSRTVLSWLRSDHRKYHQFVAHRVGEILETTEQTDWRWVPSKMNVADEMTKWTKPPCFDTTCRWFSGPDFLKSSEENWPTIPDDVADTEEEMKLNFAHSEITVVHLIDPGRFSIWNRMVRVLAFVIRYVRKLKCKIRKISIPHKHLSQEELDMAEKIIIRQAQFDEYPEEIVTLSLNKNLPFDEQKSIARSSSIYLCAPYLDDNGIMRVSGRIDLAKCVQFDTKRPIILPRRNQITKLLLMCYHRIYHHRNNETVVNELRQKYHIPQLRVALKSVIKHECQVCKNRKAKPQPPQMASLPFGRLAVGFRPFTYCGVDFFGPLKVVIGRRVEKRWGALFTCLTIRAVHIEIAHSINTESFIKCLRNFISLRGRPYEMFSDEGTNFKGADNVLADATAEIDWEKVATEFTTSYSKWNFNPPHAPHFAGAMERMVQSFKTALYAILPERRPSDETLRNLLMEISNVINSRPLTFIPLENENDEALTPNHFLLGASNSNKPPCPIDPKPNLRSAWRENQRLTELFWQRFVKEYLPTLTRRSKWIELAKPLDIGDFAIDIDPAYPRNSYPKVRVIDRTMDSIGQVRRVRVQFANGSMLWRPASTVARLDIYPRDDSIGMRSANDGVAVSDFTNVANQSTAHPEVPPKGSLTAKGSSSKTEGNVAKPTRSSARILNKRKMNQCSSDRT